MGRYWNWRNLLDKASAAQSLSFRELAIAGEETCLPRVERNNFLTNFQ
jgi:hypothetical protein